MSADLTANLITFELDMNAPMATRLIGQGEDGPEYGPMSLFDAVVAEVAGQIMVEGRKLEAGVRAR